MILNWLSDELFSGSDLSGMSAGLDSTIPKSSTVAHQSVIEVIEGETEAAAFQHVIYSG